MAMQLHDFQGLASLAPLGKKFIPRMAPLNCSRTSLQRSTHDSKILVENLSEQLGMLLSKKRNFACHAVNVATLSG